MIISLIIDDSDGNMDYKDDDININSGDDDDDANDVGDNDTGGGNYDILLFFRSLLLGLNPDMLDIQPDELIALKDDEASKTSNPAAGVGTASISTEEVAKSKDEKGMIAASEHPKYGKFFKMLKVGIPLAAVKAKVGLEGLDAEVMDKSPDELIPLDDDNKNEKNKKDGDIEKVNKMVKVSEHPKYAKFFKMLKIGLPVGKNYCDE
jgi:hypothetical protein